MADPSLEEVVSVMQVMRTDEGKNLSWLCDGEVHEATIDWDVKALIPDAFEYLQKTFVSHHTGLSDFNSKKEFNRSKKLFDALFRDIDGKIMPVSIWTSYEILFVAWLFRNEYDKLQVELKNYLLSSKGRPGPVVINMSHYCKLHEQEMQRIHKAVAEEIIFPKVQRQGALFLSFFGKKKLAELAEVQLFTKEIYNAHFIRKYHLANSVSGKAAASTKRCFYELHVRMATVNKYLAKDQVFVDCGISDDFKEALPPGPTSIWSLIDAACCASNDYDVFQLAPTIHRSVPPVADIEARRCQNDTCECSGCGCFEVGSTSFKCCARCRLVFYCSTQCQRHHWKHHHKTKCVPFIENKQMNEKEG